MSRGIDVKEINMVINYDVPHDADDYVHRVGRTARINAKGEAITLVTPREKYKIKKIEQLIESVIPKIEAPADLGKLPSWEEKDGGAVKKKKFQPKKKTGNNDKQSAVKE